ncbi:hypothetical protein [Zoogloea sp.]|uniref:hypothetical protein n=1 Tax=Zoogloea sp. TaxID=49181 RepID=UPI0035B1D49D
MAMPHGDYSAFIFGAQHNIATAQIVGALRMPDCSLQLGDSLIRHQAANAIATIVGPLPEQSDQLNSFRRDRPLLFALVSVLARVQFLFPS